MFNKLFNLGEVFREQCYLLIIWCWYDFGNRHSAVRSFLAFMKVQKMNPNLHNTGGLIITLTFSLTTKQHNFGMFIIFTTLEDK